MKRNMISVALFAVLATMGYTDVIRLLAEETSKLT